MSAPQNDQKIPLATVVSVEEKEYNPNGRLGQNQEEFQRLEKERRANDAESQLLREDIRQKQEEIQRLEQERKANEEERQRLAAESLRHKEESLRHKEVLLRLRRERDALTQHIRHDELRFYKRKRKELGAKIGASYLQAIGFLLKLRREPITLVRREHMGDFIPEKVIPLEAELLGVESRILKIKAERLGVEINSNPDWWNGNDLEELSATGRTKVAKLVREERRRNIEWWVKVLVPIAAAMIGLLSLLIALITVSKK